MLFLQTNCTYKPPALSQALFTPPFSPPTPLRYDNLEIQYRVTADRERLPLEVFFPEGRLVGIAKSKLLVMVSYRGTKPTSMTTKVRHPFTQQFTPCTPRNTPLPTPRPIHTHPSTHR